MALLPGSPARDAAAGSTAISDQRGCPIIGIPDIGAYEAGNLTNYDAWICESLPATATAAQRASTFDYDGDGQTNGDEWNYLTHPAGGGSFFAPSMDPAGADIVISFPTAAGRNYTLQRSDTLAAGSWADVFAAPFAGDGSIKAIAVPAGAARTFFRVLAGPPQ